MGDNDKQTGKSLFIFMGAFAFIFVLLLAITILPDKAISGNHPWPTGIPPDPDPNVKSWDTISFLIAVFIGLVILAALYLLLKNGL